MLAWIAAGGALGATFRYLLGTYVASLNPQHFYLGTMTCNVLGSFCIGIVYIIISSNAPWSKEIGAFFMVGLLGAFTTFSSFSLDSLRLIDAGAYAQAFANVLLSVVLCLLATAAGLNIARKFIG